MIPFVDLKTQYRNIKKELDDRVGNVMENAQQRIVSKKIRIAKSPSYDTFSRRSS